MKSAPLYRRFGSASMMLLILAAACVQPEPASPPSVASLSPEVPVAVSGGKIQGAVSNLDPEVMSFMGLPFAAPPVGNLRWRPPEPVVAWDGVRDTTAPGPICQQGEELEQVRLVMQRAQRKGDDTTASELQYGRLSELEREITSASDDEKGSSRMLKVEQEQSENCLFLNVWAPRQSMELRPVMVWIHGGGFVVGSGSDPLTDGTRLASRGAVVVTLNYRLGAFGFMAHPALSAESAYDTSGNYGLLDIVAALGWVRENAVAFGGDPDRVTIFGESAGAGAVMSVMLMPQAGGLFHRAIAESSFIDGWDRRLREPFGGLSSAEQQGSAVGEALGATGDSALSALRSATPVEIFEAVAAAGLVGLGGWAPIVEGWSIPADPVGMYAAGRQHQVPLITGINGNEGSLLTQGLPMQGVAAFETYVRTTYPSVADVALAHYAVEADDEAKLAIDQLFHDMLFAGPLGTLTARHARFAPVWTYHFTLVPPTQMGASHGSHHAAEITYVFGNLIDRSGLPAGSSPHPMSTGVWTEMDHRVSDAMMAYWVHFAATGDPNRDGLMEWPEFDLEDQHLVFGADLEVGKGLHAAGMELYVAHQSERRGAPLPR